MRLEQLADFVELGGRRLSGGERLEHQFRRRSVERPRQQVAYEVALRLILGIRRGVDVGSGGLVAGDESLLRHDLEELEHGRIAGLAAHRFGDFTNGAGAAVPEDAKDRQLGVSRFPAKWAHICAGLSTTPFVDVNTNVFVYWRLD